jgi:hypothetical protein
MTRPRSGRVISHSSRPSLAEQEQTSTGPTVATNNVGRFWETGFYGAPRSAKLNIINLQFLTFEHRIPRFLLYADYSSSTQILRSNQPRPQIFERGSILPGARGAGTNTRSHLPRRLARSRPRGTCHRAIWGLVHQAVIVRPRLDPSFERHCKIENIAIAIKTGSH